MALEIEGTLAQKLPVQSGSSARGPWAKQEFVLEFPDGNFTAKACFTAWGQEKVQDLDKYQVGDKVKVSLRFRGRERDYTQLGFDAMKKFADMVADYGVIEKEPKMEGRRMNMFLAPKKDKK